MGKPAGHYLTLTLLLSGLIVTTASCGGSSVSKRQTLAEPLASPVDSIASSPPEVIPPTPTAQQPQLSVAIDPYELAMDKAASATSISGSATSADDWKLAMQQLQEAIALMKTVPSTSRYKASAKTKIAQYQRQLSTAKRQVARAGSGSAPPEATIVYVPGASQADSTSQTGSRSGVSRGSLSTSSVPGSVYRARIKRREGGIPVIEVVFNGNQTFDMIVDTGASGTLITQRMAAALGVKPFTSAIVDTASQKNVKIPIGYVSSIEVGGAVLQRVPVAIAGPNLDTGLLGHDFFGGFDVTIKRDVVEFQVR